MYLTGQAVLGATGMPVAGLTDADGWWLVAGLGATVPFFPIVGLALGAILRSTAAGITTVLGLIWLPVIFEGFLPGWWRENVVSLLPGPAVDSFTFGYVVDSPSYSEPMMGAVVAGAWLVLIVGGAYLSFLKRDA
jgi:ABC-2 type transport system permease protein